MISSLWSHQLCFHGTLRKRRTPWHLSNAKSSAAAAHATSSHHSHLCSSKRLARFTSVHRLHCQPAAGAGVGFEGRVCIGLDAAAPEHACSFADSGLHALYCHNLPHPCTARSSSKRCFKQTFWWQRPQTTWQQNRQADAVCLCNLCMLHALASDTL